MKATCIFVIVLAYFYVENRHFGWNAWPKSDNELLADGIGFILIALWVLAWEDV